MDSVSKYVQNNNTTTSLLSKYKSIPQTIRPHKAINNTVVIKTTPMPQSNYDTHSLAIITGIIAGTALSLYYTIKGKLPFIK